MGRTLSAERGSQSLAGGGDVDLEFTEDHVGAHADERAAARPVGLPAHLAVDGGWRAR